MDNKFKLLKEKIKLLASSPDFIHHKWYIKWHLEIVEKIALELCEIYKDADRDIVLALVWIHDYVKITDFNDRNNPKAIIKVKDPLKEVGFESDFIDKVINYLVTFENKMSEDLVESPIEIQIVSSADAASHMVGPFYFFYWYENSDKTIEELLGNNLNKLKKDWERKITLPEVKEKFQNNHAFIKSMSGDLQGKFFSSK